MQILLLRNNLLKNLVVKVTPKFQLLEQEKISNK